MITTISVLTVVGAFVAYRLNKMALNNAIAIAKGEAEKTANYVKADLQLDLGFARALANSLNSYCRYDTEKLDSIFITILKYQAKENPRYMSVWCTLEYSLITKGYTKNYGRRSFTAFLKDGTPFIEVEQKNVNGDINPSPYWASKSTNVELVLDPYVFQLEGKDRLATTVSVPVRRNGTFQGLGGVDLELSKFQKIIDQTKPFPNTIVSILSNNGTIIAHTNTDLVKKTFKEISPEEDIENQISERIKKGKGIIYYTNNSGEKRLVIFAPIQVGETPTPWSVGLSIPVSVIMSEARSSLYSVLIVTILGLIVLGFVIWLIARSITEPIQRTTDLLQNLAQGDIDKTKKVFVTSGDEIEAVAKSVSKVIDGLNITENFAREIGKGNLDAQFELLGEKDTLGKSLLEMQKSLKHAREIEIERKNEEEKQNWTTKGIAMFGDILRQNNDNLIELSYNIIKNLVSYTSSIQGGIFVLNDNDKENPIIDMAGCYAYDRRKYLQKSVVIGEGLVGRCFTEGKSIFMVDIPKDYISITSGLGKENPRCLLLVPLKINDEVLGVIEMATFKIYEKYHIDFIEKVATSIAATISSVRINIRTAELLAKSQQQAEEMAAQEEEMRQNMEELQATQEEMERLRQEDARNNQAIIKKGEDNFKLIIDLLNNIPAKIFLKDENGSFVLVNSQVADVYNKTPEEIIGTSDYENHPDEDVDSWRKQELDIMRMGKQEYTFEETIGGKKRLLRTIKMPFVLPTSGETGLLGIQFDITNYKQMAEEIKKQG